MAEELEESIIIIEESDAASTHAFNSEDIIEEESSGNKKILLIIASIVVLIIVIVIAILLLNTSEKSLDHSSLNNIEEKLQNNKNKVVEPTQMESMIAKADYLYATGSREKALELFEKIALYSEAVSAYNLGVAQLKDEQYQNALNSFVKAIANNEKRCVSAINAAVCALHLNKQKSFKYYIDLAYAYLPYEKQSAMYSYYYALINYYNANYLEVLSALKNPTTKEYAKTQNNLSAKINSLFGNNYDALESLEKNQPNVNEFSLGLAYARVGDLTLSKKYFQEAITKNIEPVKSQIALGYIYLKSGQIADAAKEIDNVTDMFEEEVYQHYPIRVNLKDALFDTNKAQQRYREKVINNKRLNYQKIFYYSPYKVFNANRSISYIRKANASMFIDNIQSAQEYLKKSSSSSSVNVGIVRAIKKALTFKLRESNEMLQKLVKIQPKHSILHYNLALTYAQMGDMVSANKHFLRSYYLDSKNYLSGVYAVMTSQLINKDHDKLLAILKESLYNEEESEKNHLYKTLLQISQNDMLASARWLNNDYKQRPLYLALDIIIAIKQQRFDVAKKSAEKLTILLPNEILPHLMYIDTSFNKLAPKKYANKVLNYLKVQKFDFNDLYYGPYITRYLYIQQNLITGRLYYLREQLKHVLESTTEHTQELTSSLALASLYDRQYEEAYTLYNNLIDNLKVRDSYTLFLGAVASTAANHHANAIALLELSKMKDGDFIESRYALGLLYLEVQNNKGATIQFRKINKLNFISEFFNFNIDTARLLFEKKD